MLNIEPDTVDSQYIFTITIVPKKILTDQENKVMETWDFREKTQMTPRSLSLILTNLVWNLLQFGS